MGTRLCITLVKPGKVKWYHGQLDKFNVIKLYDFITLCERRIVMIGDQSWSNGRCCNPKHFQVFDW